jgi:uncharacterized protein YdcH (DUF465 family)
MFVLSCAPINGFNNLIQQSENLPQLSLVEQAHRFAEMQALFQVPTHLPPNDPFHVNRQIYEREQQEERNRRLESMKQQREKLQSSIETHKDRLEKGRVTPRRFPMESKPSMQSPRAKFQGRTQQSTPFNQVSYDSVIGPMVDSLPPSSAMQATPQHPLNGHSVDSMLSNSVAPGSALEGAMNAAPGTGSPTANNPPSTTPSSPKRPKTISFEEFEQKTEKINEDLKKLVREVVHQEMIADGQAQHYTRRFQNKLLATKQETLVDKIEKVVGQKIQEMQKEIEELKEQKVKGKKKKNPLRESFDEDAV